MASLAQRGTHAAAWNYAGNITRIVLQFGVGILLSRLIGPEGFGVVAIALLLVSLGQLFVDFGFNAAIVQADDLRDEDIAALGTLQIIVGLAMTAGTFAGASLIARFFHQPAAMPVIEAVGFMFLLRAIGQNAVALLSRELRFRAVQIATIAGYLVGYVGVAVPMAFAGFGAWSIVAGQLVQTALTSTISIYQVGHFHRMTLRGLRYDMLNFGRLVVTANIGSWSLSNLDTVMIGHVAGATPLAFYNRSMLLSNAPTQAILSGLQGVLFAASARAQENPNGCRRAQLTAIEFMMVISCPLLFAVAVSSKTVLLALYGQQWVAAAPLLAPLCIASVVNGVLGFFGPVIMGMGRVERETRAQWATAAIMLPTVYMVAHISAVAVAWSVIGLYMLRLFFLFRALDGVLPLDRRRMLNSILPGLALGLFAAAGAAIGDWLGEGAGVILQLLTVVSGAGVAVFVGVLVLHRFLMRGALGQLVLESKVIPVSFRKLVARRIN